MKQVTVEFTIEELMLLASLASDQLFRREFIDPKMPGYKADPAEVRAGKSLVARLRAAAGQTYPGSRSSTGETDGDAEGSQSKRPNGRPDAV